MRKIQLRKCVIDTLEAQAANAFLDEHHRQGAAKRAGALNSIGLWHEQELIAVIQFCYPRTEEKKRRYSAELLRLAFKADVRVYRGASALIQYYIERFNPADFFTYQDTSGEATSVYEHAGMTLVSQAKKKQYLVAPGKTLASGSRKEVLGMSYATRYGPDRILGAKLGEVFRADGTRKSNKDIFIEELGWHVEETSGDRVYEWVNPAMSHYVYKITAEGSDKYYYGARTIALGNATVEDCLADPYMGSGGKLNPNNKFNNFKKRYAGKLKKEIIEIFDRKSFAYDAEEKLIGELWRTDALCLNSAPGGRRSAPVASYGPSHFVDLVCPVHGLTPHSGGKSCAKCSMATIFTQQQCAIHGETTFRGDSCVRCNRKKSDSYKECSTHGLSLHQGASCYLCASAKAFVEKVCPTHGLTAHAKDSCVKCYTSKAFSQRSCPVHGLVTFRGEECIKCQTNARITELECPVHGMTKHQGAVCARCAAEKTLNKAHCEKHGEAVFTGKVCARCRAEASVNKRECAVHGLVTHVGSKCRLCINQKSVVLKECVVHGLTKYQGEKCSSCASMATAHRLHHGKKANMKCAQCNPALLAAVV